MVVRCQHIMRCFSLRKLSLVVITVAFCVIVGHFLDFFGWTHQGTLVLDQRDRDIDTARIIDNGLKKPSSLAVANESYSHAQQGKETNSVAVVRSPGNSVPLPDVHNNQQLLQTQKLDKFKQSSENDAQKEQGHSQSKMQSSDKKHSQGTVVEAQAPKQQQLQSQSQIAATSVRLVSLPCDDTNEFVPFVRRSVGCTSSKSCCFEPSHCKDCPALGYPCRVTDAVKPVNDASVFNAMILRHPIRRVMSCFINVGLRQSCCGFPTDVATAVANKKMSLKEFVSHHCVSNGMTRALAGEILVPCNSEAVTQNQYEKAKTVLLKMDFVGLREYLPESTQLFQAQLKQRGFVKVENISASEVKREPVSPVYGEEHKQRCLSDEENVAIHESNHYDIELYDLAVRLFFRRLCALGVHCYPKTEMAYAVSLDADPHYWYHSPYTELRQIVSFLHIPKTAGSAFVRVLRHFVGCDPVCWCTGTCHTSCPYVVSQCGHNSDIPIETCGGEPVVSAVMMREPVSRLVSNYEHAKTVKGGECCGLPLSVVKAVSDTETSISLVDFSSRPGVANAMTRMLAGFDIYDATVIADNATFERAKSRLSQFAFIGLQELYTESVKLFYKRMKSSVTPEAAVFKVHNKGRNAALKVSEDESKQIRKSNSLDVQLYSMAKTLFYKRLCAAGIACNDDSKVLL